MTASLRATLSRGLLVLASLLLAAAANAQDGTEVVRGRVVGPDGRAVEGALVTITGTQSQTARTARTNARGVYTALFPSDEEEYLVTVRSIGFAPHTARAARTGDASVVVADVALSPLAVQMEPVTVTAVRSRPPRVDRPSIGGAERDALQGALFSLDPADLTALASAVPGVLAIIGANGDTTGFSVLGAPPDQNNVVVDGSTFDGATLPSDALGAARLVTTSFDPGRGQFSGGQLAARTRAGTDLFQANVRGTMADRRLAWADPASPMPVPSTHSVSGSAGGPIRRGKTHYFVALELHRSASPAVSLLSSRPASLAGYGLSPDTVAALSVTLGSLGVPLTTDAITDYGINDRRSGFLRLDFAPTAATSVTVRADGAWTRRGGSGISALGFPSLASASRTSQFGLQVRASGYVGGFLDEFRSSLRRSTSDAAPYLSLPSGLVRVGVRYEDGRDGLAALRFGGGAAGTNERDTRRWETTNELSWFTTDSRHRVKFGQSIALDHTATRQSADRFGMFSYSSLADLAANRPSSYTRTLAGRERSTGMVTGALWIGDEWRAKSALQFQLGLRLDAARPTTTPEHNPRVDSLFGLRTDRVPRDLGISPRVGFSWVFGETSTAHGVASDRATRIAFGGRGITLSGGIGAFRGVIPPGRIAGLGDATGLPRTTTYLVCVGDATPIPEWSAPSDAGPETCLDGTAPATFSARQPSVTVFAPGFRAPLSWRANLGVAGLRVAGWGLGVSTTYSLGVNGESSFDLNLRRTPAFTLGHEENRPVFVASDAIVPTTGAVAPSASRISDRFGRVTSLVSDLRSVATELQVTLAPPRPLFGRFPVTASYTYSHHRAQERGFTGSTAGDPFVREWAPGRQPAHQIQVTTMGRVGSFSLGVRLNVRSGTPYTPMVAGDVNGDGASLNDRAFVFDPAATADSTLAAQMRSLLASAPRGARDCLGTQLGRIAGRNSCQTGWEVRPDLTLNFVPAQNLGVSDRLRLSLTMVNASGALFRVLGLSDSPLARTTALTPPDPRLLYVTGFDPVARRYQYRVNQQFGDASDYGAAGRRFSAPFRVQVGLEYRFGGPPRNAMARRLRLLADRNQPPLTADQVRERLRRMSSNPITLILGRRDSLGLTAEQFAALEAISSEFRAAADSALAPLVVYVATRRGKVSDAELGTHLGRLFPEMRRLMLAATKRADQILTPEQKRQLAQWWSALAR